MSFSFPSIKIKFSCVFFQTFFVKKAQFLFQNQFFPNQLIGKFPITQCKWSREFDKLFAAKAPYSIWNFSKKKEKKNFFFYISMSFRMTQLENWKNFSQELKVHIHIHFVNCLPQLFFNILSHEKRNEKNKIKKYKMIKKQKV